MKFRNGITLFLFSLLTVCGAFAADETNEVQRIAVAGVRVESSEGVLGPLQTPGEGEPRVTYEPSQGLVYRTPPTAESNVNHFRATLPLGWKAVRWMKRDSMDRGGGEDIPGSGNAETVTVPWDGRWPSVDLILIVAEDPARTITFGKSKFGEGTIGRELGTFNCRKGDTFELNAVAAFDDAHHVALSEFLGWNDGSTAARRTIVVNSNETYVARFEPSSWTVSFDANGGTVEPTAKTVTYGFKYGVLPTPVKNGFVFGGWSTGTGTVTADALVGPLGPHTLLAAWTAAKYRIDCGIVSRDDGNGAVTGPGEYAYGEAAKLEAKPYNGSRFLGWSDGETLNPRLLTVVSNAMYDAVFTSQYYRVQFKYLAADGIKTVYSDEQSVKHGQAAVPPDPDLVTNVDHHVFSGWKQDYENVTANHVGEQAIEASYDMTSYRVRFNANGGVGEMSDQLFAYDTSKKLSKCLFKKTDKLFIGWSKDHPSDTALFADQETVSGLTSEDGGTVDLYAVWTDEPFYTVVFEPNGATNVEGVVRQVLKNGKGGELASNRFVRVGYTFMGWSRSAAGDKVDFDDCGKITTDLAEPNETVHLWAVWNPIGYTLELDPNGGAFNSEAQVRYELTYDTEFKINLGSATREGYAFDSWGRDPSAAVGEYAGFRPTVSNLTTVAGDTVTLYVIWKPNRYTVSFDGNGKTGGEMAAQGFSYGTEQALTSNGFTRTGYVFTGWSTNQNGKVVYGDGLTVSNLTATADGNVTLYAAWNPISYTVRYDGNGAESGTMAEQTLTYDAEEDLRPNAFVRTGHVFGGWEKENGEKVEVTHKPNLATVDGAVLVLKAIWDPIPYTVTFVGNGATSGTMEPQPFVYGVTQALTSNAFKRTGHGFTGWSTNATSAAVYADGAMVSNLTTEVDGEVELFAKWSANAYKVAFDGNGGSGSVGSMDFTYGVAQALPDNGFAKTGYTFAGWDVGGETLAPGTSVSNLTEEADATVTVKATWTAIEYDVTFDKNAADATGEMADQHMVYGQTYVLSDNLFRRAHYMFDGWMTNETGTAAVYANGATVSNLTSTAGDKVSLFALWREADFYTVAFKPNGGKGEMGVQYFENGVNGSLSSNAFTRTGYAFGGWATNSTGQAVYSDGEKIEQDLAAPGETNTLFATWTPNAYTVVFDGNDATSGSMDPQPFVYDVAQALTSNVFEKTGHAFEGWKLDDKTSFDDGAIVSNLTDKASGEVTLTAQWKAKSYSLRFYDGESEYTELATNVTYGTATVRPPDPPKKEGQDFLGWFRDGSDTPFEFGGPMPAENLVLRARWDDHLYVITFDSAGGSTVAPITNAFGAPLTKPADPTKTGHTFGGWLKNGSPYDFPSTMPAEDIALMASWTVNKYNLKLDANGGSGGDDRLRDFGFTITNSNHAQSLSGITGKTGYMLSEWKTNGVEVVFPFYMPDHAVTMVAQWSPITYTIAFDGNGATIGSMDPMICKYGTEYTLTSHTYDRVDKVFTGWTNSVGRTFTDEEVVSNLTTTAGETVILYAMWGEQGTPYSRALGTELVVTVSAEGAWTADETNKKVVRSDTSTNGTLQVFIPKAGTLKFYLQRDYGTDKDALVAIFNETERGKYKADGKNQYELVLEESGTLMFSGTPPEEETFELSDFTWHPAN